MRRRELVPRKLAVRDARLFVLAVEGAETERWYVHGLVESGIVDGRRVRVEVLPPDATHPGSDPTSVMRRMAAFRATVPDLAPWDACWLVLDVDRHPARALHDVVHAAGAECWQVALSNPCFEVWLLLHVLPHAPAGSAKTLKPRWGVEKHHLAPSGGWPFERSHVDAAVARARAHDTDPKAPLPARPGTRVHLLVQDLLRHAPAR